MVTFSEFPFLTSSVGTKLFDNQAIKKVASSSAKILEDCIEIDCGQVVTEKGCDPETSSGWRSHLKP